MIIVNLINLIHLLLIICITISIFIPSLIFKEYILLILIFILLHYITNNGKCGLTQLEYYITGKPYELGFIYRIINPIIKINPKYLKNKLYIIHILYIIILMYQILYCY